MKNILVVLDNQEANIPFIQKSVSLANHCAAGLRFVAFVSGTQDQIVPPALLDAIEKHALSSLQTGLELSVEIAAAEDMLAWLSEETRSGETGLAMKLNHLSDPDPEPYTPADWKLIRHLHCPLLLCCDKKWKTQPIILATVDIDESSERQEQINALVLASARQWTANSHGLLHVAYVIPIARVLEELDIVEEAAIMHQKGDAARKDLQLLLEKHRITAESVHIAAGNTASRITRIAGKLKADLVVVGGIGRKGVKGLLLGNTAEKIIDHIRTDLLIIKS